METSTKAIGGGILLLGIYALLKPKAAGDVVPQGEALVLGPPAPSSSLVATPAFLTWEQGQTAPATTQAPQGTPGTLRVDVDLDVSSLITGIAMDKVRTDVLAPNKLKGLLAYVAKNCPTMPKMTGTATGGVAKGGSGLIITVRVPVLFTKAPDAGMVSCVTAALKKSNSEVRNRLQSLTLKAEK